MNIIINLNKPSGITSQQAVTKAKRIFRAKKAGHTGTLDPMATGILLVCLNEATKISGFLLGMDKEYKVRAKFGERTDTYDSEGEVLEIRDISLLTETGIKDAVKQFTGKIRQKPPMYSAVKMGGKALYKLARKGIQIERPERNVEVYDIEVSGIELPYIDFTVSCSKGTYIRTLCEDLGHKLGCGAHLVALERTRIGFFDIKDSASFDDLLSIDMSRQCINNGPLIGKNSREVEIELLSGRKYFCSMDYALSNLKELVLNDEECRKAKNGLRIDFSKTAESGELHENNYVRLKDPSGNLFGTGHIKSNMIWIKRILNL